METLTSPSGKAVRVQHGSIALTRHSAKHCRGGVHKASRSRVIIASPKKLGSKQTRKQFIEREVNTLLAIQKQNSPDNTRYYVEGGEVHFVVDKPKKPKRDRVTREPEYDTWKDIKPFKPLNETAVSASAKGGFNSGTKDRRVSVTARGIDVDVVNQRTGVISLHCDRHYRTKVSDNTCRERLAFRDAIVEHKVRMGLACWMPKVKKNRKLSKAALRK